MKTVLERFEEKYLPEPNTGCWLWHGARQTAGYGRFVIKYVGHMAHRVSYELYKGPIPEGLHLDHLCRVPECVNPEHLEPVTQAENNRRGNGYAGRNLRKTSCKRGHEFTADNIIPKRGGRECRTCTNMLANAGYYRRTGRTKKRKNKWG